MLRRVIEVARGIGSALDDAWESYRRHRGALLGAALAFYMLLSIAPLLVIAVAIAGMVFGAGEARAQALAAVEDLAGTRAVELVGEWVDAAYAASSEATAVGALLFLVAAARVFAQLESVLDTVWDVPVPRRESWLALARAQLGRRAASFGLMLGFGLVIAGMIVAQTALEAAAHAIFPREASAQMALRVAQIVLVLVVLTLAFALAFRRAPHRHIELRETWLGGLVTACLFTIGNTLLSHYFTRADLGAAYGAAGSVVAVLVWLLYSSQIAIYGAELTRVVAMRGGRVRAHPEHAPTWIEDEGAPPSPSPG